MLQSYLLDTVPGLVPEDIKQRYPNDKTGQINTLLGKNPLLFDSYLTNAIEVDVDCLCDGKDVFVCGIMHKILVPSRAVASYGGWAVQNRCKYARSGVKSTLPTQPLVCIRSRALESARCEYLK